MRKKYIIGNWKMNKTTSEAGLIANSLKCRLQGKKLKAQVVVCPPFTALDNVKKFLQDTNIQIGAQNVYYISAGAYTGEISVDMLKDLDVKYCIVGHSERREHFFETDKVVNKKIEALLEANISPIICVGESLETREKNEHKDFVELQLRNALDGIDVRKIGKCIIAYEPIWAIGTGIVATKEQAQDMCEFIRYTLQKLFGNDVSENIAIIYGGSVNIENAREFFLMPDIDGTLIGGASLKPEFADIALAEK